MLERFICRMIKHVRKQFYELLEEATDDQLREQISAGIEKAAVYDVTAEQALALYIDLIFGIGDDFEKLKGNEWVLATLQKEDLEEQQKMELIYARLDDGAEE